MACKVIEVVYKTFRLYYQLLTLFLARGQHLLLVYFRCLVEANVFFVYAREDEWHAGDTS